IQPPANPAAAKSHVRPPRAQPVAIKVNEPLDHTAPVILHAPYEYDAQEGQRSGSRLCLPCDSKVSAGMQTSTYPSLADKFVLPSDIPCVHLDHRRSARNMYGMPNVLATFDYLDR
ncbi:hypothetical protein DAEQUDRAFT_778076, partial [Daedalea quercina L-15889]